jgi:cytochrome c oxidase subunit 2
VKNKALATLAALGGLMVASSAMAAQPVDWQTRFQPAATSVMESITWFEEYTLWFIIPITLLVLGLLVVAMVRFREGANPVASKTSHNTLIEVIWTVGPVIVLLFFAVPSFQILTEQLTQPENPDLTVKATATQWQWNYEYQMENPVAFDSIVLDNNADAVNAAGQHTMLDTKEREELGKADIGLYPRLLAVDNELVIPVGKTVRMLVTAAPTDVIHAFAMPAFGLKIDAVPGRLNETWFKADQEGIFYGQCSELCGKDHSFMPIAIRVVSEDKYKAWLAAAATDLPAANKALMASADASAKTVDVAANNAQ